MKTTSSFLDLPQSGIRRMYDLAKNKKDTVSFVLGEPDFVTPKHIIEAAKKKLDEGCTHYTDNAGILPLRQEISRALKQYDKVDYDPEGEIVVTVGGMMGMYMAILALVNPGDEILIADPSYTNYVGEIVMNRAVAVPVPVYEKDNFNFTYENLKSRVTDKTKAIILNSPCNPTGGVATRETMETVAKVALEYDLYVIYDAVYKHLIYNDTDYINIAVLDGMRERTIYVDSFSKTYAMTGWRLGYAVGPEPVIKVMTKIHQSCIMSAPTTSQYAAIAALHSCDDSIEMMRDEYNRRRRYVVKALNDMGLTCFEPRGAFYVFPCIRCSGLTSQEFCEMLLKEQEVAIIPGDAFGASGEGYARISYAYSVEHLETAMRRIRTFLKDHGWLAE